MLVAEFVEGAVVDPHVLGELELTDQAGADDERGDAAIHTVVGRALGQCRTVGSTAANHPVPVHVVRSVARVEASRVRSQRASIPVRIHLLIVEVVVAHTVRAQLGIVLIRCQHQRGTAAPAAHELRGEQFLIVRRVGVLVQIVAEQSNVLLQPPVGHVASIAAQDFWLRQIGRPVLVGIAEDELSRLQRRAGPRRRLFTRSLDHQLRQPVPEPEVIMCIIERRRRVQIQHRQTAHTLAPGHKLVVFSRGASMFGVIAREQDRDCVQVTACQTADPVVRVVSPGIAQDVCPSRHALAKRLRESCQGFLGHSDCS